MRRRHRPRGTGRWFFFRDGRALRTEVSEDRQIWQLPGTPQEPDWNTCIHTFERRNWWNDQLGQSWVTYHEVRGES